MFFGNVPEETSESSVERLSSIVPVSAHTDPNKYNLISLVNIEGSKLKIFYPIMK